MKAVLISIRPEWCELIANGKKTIEVRKTRPKLETPFKCYIYCTKEHTADDRLWIFGKKARELFGASVNIAHLCGAKDVGGAYKGNGKVIGEFVCDKIFDIYEFSGSRFWLNEALLKAACLSLDEVKEYAKSAKEIYGWHISDLVIYDKPKELSEFGKSNYVCPREDCEGCYECVLTRPPQSWCYVEIA